MADSPDQQAPPDQEALDEQGPPDDNALIARLHQLRDRIADAATESGRQPQDVQLLLATKTVPAERIAVALRAAFTLIGENRVQEIVGKADALQAIPHSTQLIGHLQRNKVNAVLPLIDGMHSLDSAELAQRIDRRLTGDEAGRMLPVMIQVNVSGEDSKSGVAPEAAAALADAVRGCPRLELTGLMTIGLNSTDLAEVRRGYARLRELRDAIVPGGELSMGMSGDFADAIAEGATVVRLGSAAFGNRRPTG
ncbi:MAG: YggS family pyridoxal phosphate-dependent enzyme [Nakamurella sp.]